MSKKIIYLLLAVSLGLNIGVIATTLIHQTAGPPEGPRPGPGPGQRGGPGPGQQPDPARLVENHLQGMTRHLDLSSEQQQEIRTVLERFAPQLTKFQTEAADAGGRLAGAYADAVFDPERVLMLTRETSAARARLDSMSAVMLVAEAAVLTPEQRRKYAETAPTIHSNPQRPPGQGGPPPRKRPR
jgi:Spy/CpxP family protein refolding chaperone